MLEIGVKFVRCWMNLFVWHFYRGWSQEKNRYSLFRICATSRNRSHQWMVGVVVCYPQIIIRSFLSRGGFPLVIGKITSISGAPRLHCLWSLDHFWKTTLNNENLRRQKGAFKEDRFEDTTWPFGGFGSVAFGKVSWRRFPCAWLRAIGWCLIGCSRLGVSHHDPVNSKSSVCAIILHDLKHLY